LACRDLEKAEEAAKEITNETRNKVTTLKLDLASLTSIRTAVQELKTRHPLIHILINNAGMQANRNKKNYETLSM
jgi:short-subunit dehydrogenase